ncbi:hypothetical protein EP47_13560 [Legionella norrlandica]|uniref:WH2 domain-containing protein n=1 Tax=Legionella norrlandica TaxID=1498499 RepID=A0A0A2SM31_9GAMM|nr:hypothetical protein [Legionella norrlandica]KGP62210.1 hypothetical protein EP47_13560 [Legionella norrlandica]
MFGKRDNGPIQDLQKKQAALVEKINLLQGEVRRLREEISKIEVTKGEVNSNKVAIEKAIKEIEGLQKGIKDELGKLSRKTREIKSSTPELSSNTETITGGPPIPPPPPPSMGIPPPPPPPIFKKGVKPQVTSSKPTESQKQTVDPKGAMLDQLKEGVKLKKSNETEARERTEEQIELEKREEIQRYEKSILTKEAEIERLIAQVSDLSTKLETAKVSQKEYQLALQSQTELISSSVKPNLKISPLRSPNFKKMSPFLF